MFIVRSDRDARQLSIGMQIPRRCEIRIYAHNFCESSSQRKREEPNSGIEIERKRATRICRHGLQQILDQEAVHLKEGKMADAVFMAARVVEQETRPCQFKPILLLIQQKQTLDPRQRFPKNRRQLRRWLREFLERHV